MTSHASAEKKRSFGAQARAAALVRWRWPSRFRPFSVLVTLCGEWVREGDAKVTPGVGFAAKKFVRFWEEERG